MRLQALGLWIAATLVAPCPVSAGDGKPDSRFKPHFVVRADSIEALIADTRILLDAAGKQKEAETLESQFKSLANKESFWGVRTTRPWGLYGRVGDNLQEVAAVILVPIADEAEFTEHIGVFNLKLEKGEAGIQKVTSESLKVDTYLRFANQYAYFAVGDKGLLDDGKLLDPATLLAGNGALTAKLNIDELSTEFKGPLYSAFENLASGYKNKVTDGDKKDWQAECRAILVEELMVRIRQALGEGRNLTMSVDVDRKEREILLETTLDGRAGSPLADAIAALRPSTSIAAGVIRPGAAFSGHINIALSTGMKNLLERLIQNAIEDDAKTPELKEMFQEIVIKPFGSTAKSGDLDAGFALHGPDSTGLYTLLLAAKIRHGRAAEQTMRDVVNDTIGGVAKLSSIAGKSGDIKIHKVDVTAAQESTRKMLGGDYIYYLVRDDAIVMTAGSDGLETARACANTTPVTAPVLQFAMSFARSASLMDGEGKFYSAAAKKVFSGGDDDLLRVTLAGGRNLSVKMKMKARIIGMFLEADELKKATAAPAPKSE